MQVMVTIMLATGDELNMTPDEVAVAILEGLNGDENKDIVTINVQQQAETGSAGAVPVLPSSV